jgi:hypothetical protein
VPLLALADALRGQGVRLDEQRAGDAPVLLAW